MIGIPMWFGTIRSSFIAILVVASTAAADDCKIHLLKRTGDGVSITPLLVPEGEVRVIQCNGESGVITPILPYTRGISGSIEQINDGAMYILRNDGTQLHTSVQSAGKDRRDLPVIEVASLANYDIRLSVSNETGPIQSFVIKNGQAPTIDTVGPISDMFAGHVPMSPGMYSITTEVYSVPQLPKITGSIPLRVKNNRLCVTGTMPDGTELNLLLDTGGGSSLVLSKDALPAGTELAPGVMLQFTEDGVKKLDYSAGGAGGSFGIAGVLSLETLELGTMTLPDITAEIFEGDQAAILERMKIDGILGLGVLRRSDRFAFEFDDSPRVVFLPDDEPVVIKETDVVLPFSHAMSHLVTKVGVNGTDVPMILDTGSPGVILTSATSEKLGIETAEGQGKEGMGIDGRAITFSDAIIHQFQLPGATLDEMPIEVGKLQVMEKYGGFGGLLGVNVLREFARAEYDFSEGTLRLQR